MLLFRSGLERQESMTLRSSTWPASASVRRGAHPSLSDPLPVAHDLLQTPMSLCRLGDHDRLLGVHSSEPLASDSGEFRDFRALGVGRSSHEASTKSDATRMWSRAKTRTNLATHVAVYSLDDRTSDCRPF